DLGAHRLQRVAVIAREVSADVEAQRDVVPRRLVIEGRVAGHGLVVEQREKTIGVALLNGKQIESERPALRERTRETLHARTGVHLFQIATCVAPVKIAPQLEVVTRLQ